MWIRDHHTNSVAHLTAKATLEGNICCTWRINNKLISTTCASQIDNQSNTCSRINLLASMNRTIKVVKCLNVGEEIADRGSCSNSTTCKCGISTLINIDRDITSRSSTKSNGPILGLGNHKGCRSVCLRLANLSNRGCSINCSSNSNHFKWSNSSNAI